MRTINAPSSSDNHGMVSGVMRALRFLVLIRERQRDRQEEGVVEGTRKKTELNFQFFHFLAGGGLRSKPHEASVLS